MAKRTNIERFREAWANAPTGSKAKLLEDGNYTNQNISDILKNGRKDETIIIELIEALKIASRTVVDAENEKNKIVQAV